MVILAGLHVVSRDFTDESLCSGGRVSHKISVTVKVSSVVNFNQVKKCAKLAPISFNIWKN